MVQEINPVWENFTYIFLLKIKKIFLVIKLTHSYRMWNYIRAVHLHHLYINVSWMYSHVHIRHLLVPCVMCPEPVLTAVLLLALSTPDSSPPPACHAHCSFSWLTDSVLLSIFFYTDWLSNSELNVHCFLLLSCDTHVSQVGFKLAI